MTTRQRVCMGGLGALTPIVLNLLVIDATMLSNLTMFVFLGYVIRSAALFYVGGLSTYFHKKEINKFKLYQIGIGAPALLAMALNGTNVDLGKFDIATPLNAGEIEMQIKDYTPQHESASQQFIRGVLGKGDDKNWFVIIGEFEDPSFAVGYAKDVRKLSMFYAEVYRPYLNLKGYTVVVGCHMTIGEAKILFGEVEEVGYHPRLWKYREGESAK